MGMLAAALPMCDDAARVGRTAVTGASLVDDVAREGHAVHDLASAAGRVDRTSVSTAEQVSHAVRADDVAQIAADVEHPHPPATARADEVSSAAAGLARADEHSVTGTIRSHDTSPEVEGASLGRLRVDLRGESPTAGPWETVAQPHVIAIVPTDDAGFRAIYGGEHPPSWRHEFAMFAQRYELEGATVLRRGGRADLFRQLDALAAQDQVAIVIGHSEAMGHDRAIILASGERVSIAELAARVDGAPVGTRSPRRGGLVVFTCGGGDLAELGTVTHTEILNAYGDALQTARSRDDLIETMRAQIEGARGRRVTIRLVGASAVVVTTCAVSGECTD